MKENTVGEVVDGEEKAIFDRLLKFQIRLDQYYSTNSAMLIKLKQREIIIHFCDEIIKQIEDGKPLENAEKAIDETAEEWSTISQNFNLVERDTIDKKFAEVIVRLQIERCRKQNQVDFKKVGTVCTRENFTYQLTEQIKQTLMGMEIGDKNRKILERFIFLEKRRDKLLSDHDLWRALSGKSEKDVMNVVTREEQKQQSISTTETAANKKQARAVAEERVGTLFDRMRDTYTSKVQRLATYEYAGYDEKGNIIKTWIEKSPDLPWSKEAKEKACVVKEENGTVYIESACTRVVLPEGIEEIPQYAFCSTERKNDYCMLEEIVLPKTIKKISRGAFSDCRSLRSINIPKGITKIEEYTFLDCKKLKSIKLPEGIYSIEKSAFMYCESLEELEIPDSVTDIGIYAFYQCTKLRSINFPQNVYLIGTSSFTNSGLENISFQSSNTAIGKDAFSECEIFKRAISSDAVGGIVVPKGSESFYLDVLKNSHINKHIPNIVEAQEMTGHAKRNHGSHNYDFDI